MTKSQIKAELRRSACEDMDPWEGVHIDAFLEACKWRCGKEYLIKMKLNDLRSFFLLVSEAL